MRLWLVVWVACVPVAEGTSVQVPKGLASPLSFFLKLWGEPFRLLDSNNMKCVKKNSKYLLYLLWSRHSGLRGGGKHPQELGASWGAVLPDMADMGVGAVGLEWQCNLLCLQTCVPQAAWMQRACVSHLARAGDGAEHSVHVNYTSSSRQPSVMPHPLDSLRHRGCRASSKAFIQ